MVSAEEPSVKRLLAYPIKLRFSEVRRPAGPAPGSPPSSDDGDNEEDEDDDPRKRKRRARFTSPPPGARCLSAVGQACLQRGQSSDQGGPSVREASTRSLMANTGTKEEDSRRDGPSGANVTHAIEEAAEGASPGTATANDALGTEEAAEGLSPGVAPSAHINVVVAASADIDESEPPNESSVGVEQPQSAVIPSVTSPTLMRFQIDEVSGPLPLSEPISATHVGPGPSAAAVCDEQLNMPPGGLVCGAVHDLGQMPVVGLGDATAWTSPGRSTVRVSSQNSPVGAATVGSPTPASPNTPGPPMRKSAAARPLQVYSRRRLRRQRHDCSSPVGAVSPSVADVLVQSGTSLAGAGPCFSPLASEVVGSPRTGAAIPSCATDFINKLARRATGLLPVPRTNKKKRSSRPPGKASRQSRRIAGKKAEFGPEDLERRMKKKAMQALDIIDEHEGIDQQALDEYAKLFGQPLCESHIRALTALFNWILPADLDLDCGGFELLN